MRSNTRQYLCECGKCHRQKCMPFEEPYPEIGDRFDRYCEVCVSNTPHTRVLTKRARTALKAKQREEELRRSIVNACRKKGFRCRFVYQSVVINTPIACWQFQYHPVRKTLYHESTIKINFKTGYYARMHVQFRDRKMSCEAVIDYIANHDRWRQAQQEKDQEKSLAPSDTQPQSLPE